MKRYPPHDPPEYVDWVPDPEISAAYAQTVAAQMAESRALGEAGHRRLYEGLVRSRLHDITLKRWVRTGLLTKAWLGLGEEAATIGAVHALAPEDPVGPMIRNQSAAFEKGIPLEDCFKVYLATGDTITQGRDVHIGDLDRHVVSPISHVGDLVPVLAGFALAFKLRGEPRVALTWTGEGATRTGAVHEGLALAANLSLPLIVVVQDNGVALGTRRDERFGKALRALGASHGVTSLECDGNNVLSMYHTVKTARASCLAGEGPVVIYTRTFRMGGHATHDEAEARQLFSAEDFRFWGRRDPIGCYANYLEANPDLLGQEDSGRVQGLLDSWESAVYDEVEAAADNAKRKAETAIPDPALMAEQVLRRPGPRSF